MVVHLETNGIVVFLKLIRVPVELIEFRTSDIPATSTCTVRTASRAPLDVYMYMNCHVRDASVRESVGTLRNNIVRYTRQMRADSKWMGSTRRIAGKRTNDRCRYRRY